MFTGSMIATFVLLSISLAFFILKRARNKELLLMFRGYNEGGSKLETLTDWVKERHSALRLLSILEYLNKIEEYQLAADVYLALPFDAWPSRAIRIEAITALRIIKKKDAMDLGDRLREDHPGDDFALEMCIDTFLLFEHWDEAEALLLPRLNLGSKGTVFTRQKARIMAARGKLTEALEVIQTVVDRDFMLYKNTIAPAQKKMIYEQYVTSQTVLDDLRKQAGLEPIEPKEPKKNKKS